MSRYGFSESESVSYLELIGTFRLKIRKRFRLILKTMMTPSVIERAYFEIDSGLIGLSVVVVGSEVVVVMTSCLWKSFQMSFPPNGDLFGLRQTS